MFSWNVRTSLFQVASEAKIWPTEQHPQANHRDPTFETLLYVYSVKIVV